MNNNIEPNPIEVKALDNFCLYIKFANGKEKIYDMKNLIGNSKIYSNLKDKSYFKKVKVCGETVVWPNGEDVCPENLYNDSIDI